MDKILLEKYASLIVNIGAHVQKGQIVDISASTENAFFANIVAEKCYQAGAKLVTINWHNDVFSALSYKYAELDVLKEIKPYTKAKYEWIAENRAVRIFLDDDDPTAFKGIDAQKIAESSKDISIFVDKLFNPIENEYQWCIAGLPSKKWATQVFTEDTEEIAMEKLWNLIFKVCRIDKENDTLKLWNEHNNFLAKRIEILNNLDLDYLHYTNSLGTNLKVYLANGHIWKGGSNFTTSNVEYYPNLPTEEVFTAPDCNKVYGTLVSTMPLNYNGNLIKDMKFTFDNGMVTEYSASEGEDVLKNLLEMDSNSKRLGEVALVPFDNPIRKTDTLFLSTLFDENASCHFAFGEFYEDTVKDAKGQSNETLKEMGCNKSIIHVDFMVGSSDLKIVGFKKNGEQVVIFEKGNFVF